MVWRSCVSCARRSTRCVRVLMCGALDLPMVMAAVNRGEVMRLVAKPFHLDALFSALDEALTECARLEAIYGRAHQQVLERQQRALESCFSDPLLQLAVQALVDAASGAVEGCEGLLRSRQRSLNSPVSVIAVAEAHGMLRRLADQVAAAAADRLRHLPPHLTLFINAHPGELSDLTAAQRRFASLLPAANRRVIEITERSNVLEQTHWRAAIEWLWARGSASRSSMIWAQARTRGRCWPNCSPRSCRSTCASCATSIARSASSAASSC